MKEQRIFIREITEIVDYQRGIGKIKFYLSSTVIQDLLKKGYQEIDIEYTVRNIMMLKDVKFGFDLKCNLLDVEGNIFYPRG